MMNCLQLEVISKITYLILFAWHQFGLVLSLSSLIRYVMFVIFLSGLLWVVMMKLLYVALWRLRGYAVMLR